MGLYATSVTFGAPVKPVAATDAEVRARIEDQRALIGIVPGEGSVLGGWVYNDVVYAFRNKAGGATAGMYKSTTSGWSEIDLGQVLNFDGTTQDGEPVPGNIGSPTTIRGGTSGAEGKLMGISYQGLWETGGKGGMVLTDVTGTFQDNEDLQMWHGGTHTFIKNTGGDLRIRGDVIKLAREDSSERYIECNVNNAVQIFHNGTERFTTTSSGVTVTGDAKVGTGNSTGVILTSPDGTEYRLIVANGGALSASAV